MGAALRVLLWALELEQVDGELENWAYWNAKSALIGAHVNVLFP